VYCQLYTTGDEPRIMISPYMTTHEWVDGYRTNLAETRATDDRLKMFDTITYECDIYKCKLHTLTWTIIE